MPHDDLPPLSSDPDVLRDHVRQLRWRLGALDEWRGELDRRVSVLESDVLTERTARQLREALASHGRLQLSRAQQIAGCVIAIAALADLVRGFLG